MNITEEDICTDRNPHEGFPVEDEEGYRRHSVCGKFYRNFVFECAMCEELSVWNNRMFPRIEAYCYCIFCQREYGLPPIE